MKKEAFICDIFDAFLYRGWKGRVAAIFKTILKTRPSMLEHTHHTDSSHTSLKVPVGLKGFLEAFNIFADCEDTRRESTATSHVQHAQSNRCSLFCHHNATDTCG